MTSHDPHQWQQLKDLLSQAKALPDAERISFLKERCGEDLKLFAEAQSLLRHDEQASELGFLDRSRQVDLTQDNLKEDHEIGLDSKAWRRCLRDLVSMVADNGQLSDDSSTSAAVSSLAEKFDETDQPSFARNSLWPLVVELTVGRRSENLVTDDSEQNLAMEVAQHYKELLDGLPTNLREIAKLNFECHSEAEIASRLGILKRSVTRKLKLIRGIWNRSV